jgi:N-acetylglucosamine kinase-like BadF-type ATPase
VTRYLIGADVGGTKTAVGVSDGETMLARAEGAGAAVRPGRALASATVIADVVRKALAGTDRLRGDVLYVGAAGAGREPEREELRKALRTENLATTVVVSTDIEIALAAAFDEGPGIVVSAGTGSVAVGRDRSNRRKRIGGYGWQMGDEGSGYAIGRAALGAVSRAADGRSPRTALSERVLDATRSDTFDALVRWAAGASPAEVAALAPHVLDVAAHGDILAQGIADYAARELTQLVLCLLPMLDVEPPVGVAVTGGLLSTDGPLRRSVLTRFKEEPGLVPVDGPVDSVLGALRLAAREGSGAAA